MKPHYSRFVCLLAALLAALPSDAQEPETFTLNDFQLRGPVKTCVVKANYGEERFEFDREGKLVKSTTRYSDSDYDITHYLFEGPWLKERRDEVYRNKDFDLQTSIAHFYERDTTGNLLLEKIVSYDRNVQEQRALEYDPEGRLQRVVRSDLEGVDETRVEYESYKEEETVTYLLNGVVQKSVRTSHQARGKELLTVELTKEFLEGEPQRAYEQTREPGGRLIGQTEFAYEAEKNSFKPVSYTLYTYNEDGLLMEVSTRRGEGSAQPQTRKYVYQMDGSEPGNWIRQVVTPDNAIVVRQIAYYKPELPKKAADSIRN
ncbi:MAG TPA: hypothetical protein VLL47_01320 [Robiginitalea sp.]|nr:hypothetical protein [Robiginitalea sp.]